MGEINLEKTGQIEAQLQSDMEDWLRIVLMDLTGEAQRRAPKDEGTLRASGHWEISGTKGKVIFDTPYAAVQHERIDFHHTDGEAKYLEKPLKEKSHLYMNELAARLKRRLRA